MKFSNEIFFCNNLISENHVVLRGEIVAYTNFYL